MAERSSLTQVIQIGAEFTPGTAVYPNRKFTSLSIVPSPTLNVQGFRPAGSKYRAVTALNKEWVTAQISGIGTYTEIIYALSSVLTTAVVTTAGTITRLWTFTPATSSEDTVTTFTVQHGSPVRADSFSYGIIPELQITFNRNTIELAGSMIGQRLTDGITLATAAGRSVSDGVTTISTPTVTSATAAFVAADVGAAISGTGIPAGSRIITRNSATSVTISQNATATGSALALTIGAVAPLALVPILATQVSVYMDTTAAGLGGTKLTRVISAVWKISNRFGPVWVLDAANSSWVAHVETEPDTTLTLLVEADAAGMAMLTNVRANSRAFIRVEAVAGANSIETGQAYTFTLDFSGEVLSTGGFSDQEGLYAIEWTFVGVTDATWGKTFEIRVRNAITAL